MTLSITNWDKNGQNFCPEPVPSWVLKGTKANLLTITVQNCKVQDDLSVNDLQLLHSAVDELIKGLRTRRCVSFWCKYLDVSRWCTFKQQFRNFHSVYVKATLRNHIPNKLDRKQLPTTSVHTKLAGGKERNSLQEGNEGIIFVSLLPYPEKMSGQNC